MAEAAVLAARSLGRGKIGVARTVHPEYRRVIGTYGWANGLEIVEIPYVENGRVDGGALEARLDGDTAAVLVQSPNFFGVVEDIALLADRVHGQGALLITGFSDATSLGLLAPPGDRGADMVAGEGQAFGNPLNFGGPYLGILAAKAAASGSRNIICMRSRETSFHLSPLLMRIRWSRVISERGSPGDRHSGTGAGA